MAHGTTSSSDPTFASKARSTREVVSRVAVYLQPYKLLAVATVGCAVLSLAAGMAYPLLYTGPVEDSANGWVRFTYPAVYLGRVVEGIELHFEAGRVVKAHARKNEKFLGEMLESDAGARYLGEFAIGTNFEIDRFTKNILFDEKIGGSFHMA